MRDETVAPRVRDLGKNLEEGSKAWRKRDAKIVNSGVVRLLLKVVFWGKTPRMGAKCRGSVAPKSAKICVHRAVHIAHSNSSRSSKCRGSIVSKKRVQRAVGGTSDGRTAITAR